MSLPFFLACPEKRVNSDIFLLTFVPTPLGNLEDISFRALQALEDADVVLCEDTRNTKKLYHLLNERQMLVLEKKERRFFSFHSHTHNFSEPIKQELIKDQQIVYVSDAGMPSISDPGCELVRICQELQLKYCVLPGPSAVLTAFVASGFGDKAFCFYGFLSSKKQQRLEELGRLLTSPSPVIFYESPLRILQLLQEIGKLDSERILFLAKELTKLHETYFKGTPSELITRLDREMVKGEWTVVVDSNEKQKIQTLSYTELESLNLPPKAMMKIKAKLTGRSPKELYAEQLKG